jgi:prepilin-type N-terminal cleavage/methylation domain-containing protein
MKKGVTLIELIIVLAIGAILASVAIPAIKAALSDEKQQAKKDAIVINQRTEWKEIKSILQLVCLDGHIYYFARRIDSAKLYPTLIFSPKLDNEGKPVGCGLEAE